VRGLLADDVGQSDDWLPDDRWCGVHADDGVFVLQRSVGVVQALADDDFGLRPRWRRGGLANDVGLPAAIRKQKTSSHRMMYSDFGCFGYRILDVGCWIWVFAVAVSRRRVGASSG
jgi:hypothetical protein